MGYNTGMNKTVYIETTIPSITWNCEHLANENKMPHIRRTNALLGLWTSDIVTPLSLLGE